MGSGEGGSRGNIGGQTAGQPQNTGTCDPYTQSCPSEAGPTSTSSGQPQNSGTCDPYTQSCPTGSHYKAHPIVPHLEDCTKYSDPIQSFECVAANTKVSMNAVENNNKEIAKELEGYNK
jgi:hypothetical protein